MTGEPSEEPPDDDPEPWQPPDDDLSPAPPPHQNPDPANPNGTVSASVLIEGLALDNAHCMTQLPGGGFLIGHTNGWNLDRVGSNGEVEVQMNVGTVQDPGLVEEEGDVLGLAIPPGASTDDLDVYAYFVNQSSNWVARYDYDADAPEGQLLTPPGSAVQRDIPRSLLGGPLVFGPDEMLYVSTGDSVLQLDPAGGNDPDPAESIFSSGYTNAVGIAFDSVGRLWVADAGTADGTEPASISMVRQDPEDGTVATVEDVWVANDPDTVPTGLAYDDGSRSLWMTTADDSGGIWRIPLDGEGGIVDDAPALLTDPELTQTTDIDPGPENNTLRVLTSDGRVLQLDVS